MKINLLTYDEKTKLKFDNNIKIPFLLEINSFLKGSTENSTNNNYRLYAFIEHYGELQFGHYLSTICIKNKFYQIDDKTVNKINLNNNFKGNNISTLFYIHEKIKLQEYDESNFLSHTINNNFDFFKNKTQTVIKEKKFIDEININKKCNEVSKNQQTEIKLDKFMINYLNEELVLENITHNKSELISESEKDLNSSNETQIFGMINIYTDDESRNNKLFSYECHNITKKYINLPSDLKTVDYDEMHYFYETAIFPDNIAERLLEVTDSVIRKRIKYTYTKKFKNQSCIDLCSFCKKNKRLFFQFQKIFFLIPYEKEHKRIISLNHGKE